MVLPRSMRIQGHKCFDHLHRSGIKYFSNSMVLKVVESKNKFLKNNRFNEKEISCRCAVAISSKVSKRAVIRNKLRRAIHNHLRYRLEKRNKNSNKWALLSLAPHSIKLETNLLLKECDKLLHAADLIK